MTPQSSFEGKTVVLTGGSGGLGQEIGHAFLKSGADIVVTYVNAKEIPSLEKKFDTMMDRVSFVSVDLMEEQAVQQFIAAVINEHERIDVLVNTVGGYRAGLPIAQTDLKDWELMMNLNLKTAFLISKHAISQMEKQKDGKLIHVSARSGLRGSGNDAAYVASKSGIIRLVESLSGEVKDKGINVNCVLPSIIDTTANRKNMPEADYSRWVMPSDIANVMLFLASDDSRAINGAAIPVYGLA